MYETVLLCCGRAACWYVAFGVIVPSTVVLFSFVELGGRCSLAPVLLESVLTSCAYRISEAEQQNPRMACGLCF